MVFCTEFLDGWWSCEPLRRSALKTTLLTYLLTPWCRVLLEKLTGLQLVKKFPAFLWNPKAHYCIHKRPPPVPVLGQPNPVHIPTSHLLEIHPNIIHPSAPSLKATTHPKTRCRKSYAATQHLMLLIMGVCTQNMSS